jgi:hypothetical protein
VIEWEVLQGFADSKPVSCLEAQAETTTALRRISGCLIKQLQKEKARRIHACAHFGGRFEEEIMRMQILIALVKQPEILRPVLL